VVCQANTFAEASIETSARSARSKFISPAPAASGAIHEAEAAGGQQNSVEGSWDGGVPGVICLFKLTIC
jgi:hypothetical protein